MRKFLILGCFFSILLCLNLSCAPDCVDTQCVNGTCIDGGCVCEDGYGGIDCATPLNVVLAGKFHVNDACSVSGLNMYDVTLRPIDDQPKVIELIGLYGETDFYLNCGIASDGKSFSVSRQTVGSEGFQIQGISSIVSNNHDTIVMSYRLLRAGEIVASDSCSAVLTRFE